MIKIPKEAFEEFDYSDWLNFFRSVPTKELLSSQAELKKLPVEGYAAAARWIEILSNPSKMDKLYQARLKEESRDKLKDIAVGDDDEAFYRALILENVAQMNSNNISAQEVARLSQNTNVFRKELREIRSRKPKEGTVLEKVLKKAQEKPKSSGKKKTTSKPNTKN